ncbi:MAG: glycosyltransferase family 10 domain-containing protein [Pirellulaceae bacterium]
MNAKEKAIPAANSLGNDVSRNSGCVEHPQAAFPLPDHPARPTLTVAFSDQTPSFDVQDNHWVRLLSPHYNVRVATPNAPADVLFYSDWGTQHQKFPGRKIYFTGENMLPDYDECDFALTSCIRPNDPRHFRLPYYACATAHPEELLRRADFDPERTLRSKTGFCCFVVTNPRSPERNAFFRILNRRKRVDSGGRHFNNIGGPVRDKDAFVRRYKFIIAFENTSAPGYTTEKIVDAMRGGGVPIYWGNPQVDMDFNPRSFINAADFPSLSALADHVLRVDADDALYLSYLREPWLTGNELSASFHLEHAGEAISRYLESGEVARPRSYRKRRLREHAYGSPLEQTLMSLRCRVESKLWQLGIRW